MAIDKLSFGGTGNAVNPLSTFGDDILKVGNSIQQQELNRLAAERADKDLALRQQAENRAEKQYADAQAAKAAGSKYMADMSKVLESGVVSQADQEKLAAISQDSRLSPEQKQQQINAMLPKMSDAYQKNDAAKLQLLQGVTASPMMDTRDKVALLGSVADPLEKKIGRAAEHGFRSEEIDQQNKNALALEGLRLSNEQKLVGLKSQEEYNKSIFVDNTTGRWLYGRDLAKLPKDEQNKFIPEAVNSDLVRAAHEANQIAYYRVNPETGVKEIVDKNTPGAVSVPVAAIHTLFSNNGSGSGGGSGGGLNKTLQGTKDISAKLDSLTTAGLDNTYKAHDNVAMSRKQLNEFGVPQHVQDDIVATALESGVRKSMLPGRGNVFDADMYKDTINSSLDAYFHGNTYAGVAGGIPSRNKKDEYDKLIKERSKPGTGDSAKAKTEANGTSTAKEVLAPTLTESEKERAQLLNNLDQSKKDLAEVAGRYYSVIGGDPKVAKELAEQKQHVKRLKKQLDAMYDPTEGMF